MSLGTVSIVVHPPTLKDWRGDPNGASGADFQVDGCKKWPEQSPEDTTRGEDVLVRRGVWMPPRDAGAPQVTALCTVTLDGLEWRIFGQPQPYQSGRGKDKGTILLLERRGAAS